MVVRIVTDSSCDLTDAEVAAQGIEVVPLSIRFGDETFTDRVDLSLDQFWARSAASQTLPETAAPSAGNFQEVFEQAAANGADGIVCIMLSGDLSATIQSARLAAESVAGTIRVEVVDSRSVSVGLGLVVLAAAEKAATGADLDAVMATVAPVVETLEVYAALDTLDNLKKGGRIGAAQAMLGSLLNFKPVIRVNGEVHEAGKPRTRIKSLKFVVDKVSASLPIGRAAVVHGDDPEACERFIELLGDVIDTSDLLVAKLGPVVGTHGGKGVVGIAFHR